MHQELRQGSPSRYCKDHSQQLCDITIDYCNCLLAGAPQYQLNRLQAVMNSAGRLICGLSKFDHISQVLPGVKIEIKRRWNYKIPHRLLKKFPGPPTFWWVTDSVAAIEFSDPISCKRGIFGCWWSFATFWVIFFVHMRKNGNISTSGPKFVATRFSATLIGISDGLL